MKKFERFQGSRGSSSKVRGRWCATVVALLQLAPLHAQPTRNFIWKVSGPAGSLYLVGSVHLLTKDYYPLSPALDTAFKDSDLLVEEADLGELEAPASQFKLLTRGMLPGGPVARQGRVSGDLRARGEARQRSRHADRAVEALQALDARLDARASSSGRRPASTPASASIDTSTIAPRPTASACRASRPWIISCRSLTG